MAIPFDFSGKKKCTNDFRPPSPPEIPGVDPVLIAREYRVFFKKKRVFEFRALPGRSQLFCTQVILILTRLRERRTHFAEFVTPFTPLMVVLALETATKRRPGP